AVWPSGHWNGIDHRAEATCSVNPLAAHTIAGTTSNARAERRGTKYPYGRGDRLARRRRGDCGAGMRELLVRVGVAADVHRSEDPGLCDRARPWRLLARHALPDNGRHRGRLSPGCGVRRVGVAENVGGGPARSALNGSA